MTGDNPHFKANDAPPLLKLCPEYADGSTPTWRKEDLNFDKK